MWRAPAIGWPSGLKSSLLCSRCGSITVMKGTDEEEKNAFTVKVLTNKPWPYCTV